MPVWRIEDSLNIKMDEVHFKTEGSNSLRVIPYIKVISGLESPMSQEALPEGRGLRKPKGFRSTPPVREGVIHRTICKKNIYFF